MEKTLTKPKFKEIVAVIGFELPDVGLQFNVQEVGPMKFNKLLIADYENGFDMPSFRMPIMSELVQLVYASLENQNYKTAKEVISTLNNRRIIGNTIAHYVPKGMYVQDNPEIHYCYDRNWEVLPEKDRGRILMDEKTLEKKLGKYEEKSVVFSDDKSIRFTPYNYKWGPQSSLELSKNTGVIALVGGEENAEKIARASERYRLIEREISGYFGLTANPEFETLFDVDSPQTRVVGLSDNGEFGLSVNANLSEDFERGYSFGCVEIDT